MPLYGLTEGEMTRPGIPAPRRAKCPECGGVLIAKTGHQVIWHWAHQAANASCPYAGESEWHLAWKARGLDGTQEVWRHDFSRRADVFAPMGMAIEFQHSRLSKVDVIARERDWQHRLVWIFDGRRDYREGLIELDKDSLTWWNCPEMIRTTVRPPKYAGWGCRVFIDLGTGLLWYAESRLTHWGGNWSKDQSLYGFPVPEEAVVLNVLHARSATALAAMSLRPELWLPAPPLATLSS